MAALERETSAAVEGTRRAPGSPRGRRSFTEAQRRLVWERAPLVPGRDPDRWRLDVYGNPVLRPLHGCLGCFCYEFDHRVPYSLGGETTVENCDLLQTRINRLKSNALGGENISWEQIRQYACEDVTSVIDLDAVEFAVYGDVHREGLRCRAYSLFEKVTSEMLETSKNSTTFRGASQTKSREFRGRTSNHTVEPSCLSVLRRTPEQGQSKLTDKHEPKTEVPPFWLFLPSFL